MKYTFIFTYLFMVLILCKTTFYTKKTDGYTDNQGNYIWIENQHDSTFIDNGKKWYYVTSNFENWNEAVTLRKANIIALISVGVDSSMVVKDVKLYDENSVLFTKLSKIENSDTYIKDWRNAFNTDNFKFEAKKSNLIKIQNKKNGMVLKFYPQKAKITNVSAIGLSHRNLFLHSAEAGMEILEGIYKKAAANNNPHSDPIYDMHIKNAKKIIRISE